MSLREMIRKTTSPDFTRTLTVAQIADLSGAKKRSIQFWTLNLALVCDPSTKHEGSGVHRQYSLPEAAVAMVLARIAKRTISVGELVKIGAALRGIFGQRRLESPDQATRRRKATCGKHGASALAAKKNGPRAVAAVEQAIYWDAFISALHGEKGQPLELNSDARGEWKASIGSVGVKVVDRQPAGESLCWTYSDAANLFKGILT